jgi:predicted dehydrogenase
MERAVRVGIVGCGAIAQLQHIPSLHRVGRAQITAVCDKDPSLLATVGKKLRTAAQYQDVGEMLSREDLDVVDICTPPQTHAALATLAAESGCHVLVEKPATLTVQEFDSLAGSCERNGVTLCQIQNKMFEPVFRKAVDRVRNGGVGNAVAVDIEILLHRAVGLMKDESHWCHGLPAGMFTEILPHPIYMIQALLGAVEPAAVHLARPDVHGHAGSYEIVVVLEGGRGVGVVKYAGSSPKDKVIIDIHCARRSLRIDLWNSTLVEYSFGGPGRASRAVENLIQGASLLIGSARTTLDIAVGRFHSGHYHQISRFVESIRKGCEPPVTISQAREVIRVLETITGMAAADRARIS